MEARDLSAPRWGAPRARLPGTAVLLYHAVGGGGPPRYTVSRSELARHLDHMVASGSQVVRLSDLAAVSGTGTRPVVLSFDDGRASDYTEAFPLLVERGVVAEFFVNPANVGRPGFVTWEQARNMARAGMSVQSHGYEHVYLTRQSEAGLARQVADSRARIEDELGQEVRFLAAPYGDVNRRLVEAALAAGYRAVCTSWPWPARAGARTINRVCIGPGLSLEVLDRLLSRQPWPYVRRATRTALVYPAKQALLRWTANWRRPQREGIA
jgi:peptidoglycan/xylan/chitin deacetylase (PgdA/CDA1 family)